MFFTLFKKQKGPDFITNRVVRRDEIKFGFFSVVRDNGEEISTYYAVKIPQQVIHNDAIGNKTPGTLIQAEKITKTDMKGKVICTVKPKSGDNIHCLIEELNLSEN